MTWWMPAIRKMASGKVTRIPEDRRTPKYLNCQMAPGPLLEGGLESYRAHMPAIFQSSPGHHVFASILPAAALLASLLWDHPLLCQRRCWRLVWWQTAGGATEAASVCLVKADSCLLWDKVRKDERVPGSLCQHLHAGETRG